MNWRPIETAPKDGTVILGYWSPEYAETIYWSDGSWFWSHDGDTWWRGGPTHWAPFEPPQE